MSDKNQGPCINQGKLHRKWLAPQVAESNLVELPRTVRLCGKISLKWSKSNHFLFEQTNFKKIGFDLWVDLNCLIINGFL